MSLSDPTADMLTRIRNALTGRHETLNVPANKVCEGICRVLRDEGYIKDYRRVEDARQGQLRIYLKYGPLGGRRLYRGVADLPRVRGGLGIVVVSTSRGVLSDRECRDQKVGGEVLCTVY